MQAGQKSLSVNLDHVATVREQRKTAYPDLITAAGLCEIGGADGITLHLRGDRRHIQDRDVELMRRVNFLPLTIEMAPDPDLVRLMAELKPDKVTLVPERPEELTTEGGLNLSTQKRAVEEAVDRLKQSGIAVCLFLEPESDAIRIGKEIGCDAVELHTGLYAQLRDGAEVKEELVRIENAVEIGTSLGLMMNAGHGLHYQNVPALARIAGLGEFSIGHAIISRAIFTGIGVAVSEMKRLIVGSP